MSEEKKYAIVMPPYVDAYDVDREELTTFNDFKSMMRNHADDWGITGVGYLLLHGESAFLNDDSEKIIVCIGVWGKEKYVAHVSPAEYLYDSAAWYERIVVEKYDFPSKWDVT